MIAGTTAVAPIAGGGTVTARSWTARLPWVMLAVTTACVVATVPLSLGHERLFDTVTYCLTSLAFAITGAFVATRQPQNPIGWILCVQGLSDSVLDMWGDGMFYHGLPTSATGNWISEWWWILDGAAYALVFLLFPTGRLMSPRWRWVLGLLAVALIIGAPGQSLTTTNPTNRYAVDSPVVEIMWTVGLVSLVAGIAGSVVALVVRFRRSTGVDHLQLKQLVFAAALALPSMALAAFLYYDHVIVQILIAAAAPLPPLAAGLAIVRYRLYDIDLVINKAVVFTVLAGFVTAVYAGVVVGLGRLLPVGQGNLGLAIMATALVAVAFEPVRLRVQHWANRLVYGRRASPFETLAAMTRSIGEAADPSDALGEAARLLAEGTGAAQAVVWVARDGVLTARATAGDVLEEPVPVELVDGELPEMAGVALVEPVRHEGKLVGALSLAKRPGEGGNSSDRRLVEELAGQAALLLANTRLRSRLGDRLVELRTSRQRMITAQDWARHALERDLHDGAQQELVALKVKLGLARTIASREGETTAAERLEGMVAIADRAVDTLRDVARGIYPPLLESEGLASALSAQARRADLAVTVLDRTGTRYPRELEATAYFCALEALRNSVRHANADHAHVELDGSNASLVVTVSDDGDGFDPDRTSRGDGLTHMADRVDAAGGTLTVSSGPGHGTTITLALPVSVSSEPARHLVEATP